MAQIWYSLAICVILGSCGISKCDSVELKNDLADEREPADNSYVVNEDEFQGLDNILSDFLTAFVKRFQVQDEYSSDPFYRGDVEAKNRDNGGNSNKNELHRDKDCYVPYRSVTPLYCSYFVYFGQHEESEKLLLDKTYKKSWLSWILQTPIEIEYPTNEDNASDSNSIINYIYIENTDGSESIHYDALSISQGGIGQKYFKLKIWSSSVSTSGYRVAVFGKSNN